MAASHQPVNGVVISGVYGTGKTSMVEEMAHLLENAGLSYGAIDLDWLTWFDGPGVDDEVTERVFAANLAAVVANFLSAGVERFMMAGSTRDSAELEALRATVPFPLRVVRLTLPLAEIEERLGTAVTAGRGDDLVVAAASLAEGVGVGIEDLEVHNSPPIRQVATQILGWLGWM